MEIYRGFPTTPFSQPVYLTIGNFDGVHRGHQMLVTELAQAAHAAGGLAGLLTFEPHPLSVLRPEVRVARLTANEERADLLGALGLDFVLELPFTRETASTPAPQFMATLIAHLPLRELWVGPDFALGRGREGDATRLRALGETLGYDVRAVPNYDWQGEPVRSTHIRALLQDDGAVEHAARLLGRPYEVRGIVGRGAERGRRLGFPTANLTLPEDRLTPAFGVYACWAWRDAVGYPAVVNIGVRPSFDNGQPSIEAHLLDFSGDLYGETLGLSFMARLRGEQKFTDIAALIAQIGLDSERARRILADPPTEAGAGGWTELTHTADWQVRVEATTLEGLFAHAAAGMAALQGADTTQPVMMARALRADGEEHGELLVAWLNRLLLGQEMDRALFTRFSIYEVSPRGVRGVAYGHPGAPVHTEIKAVTYYDLDVKQTPAGWQATLTFDV